MNIKTRQVSSILDHLLQTPVYKTPPSFKDITINVLGAIIGECLLSGIQSNPTYDRQIQLIYLTPPDSGEKEYVSPKPRKHIINAASGEMI